MQKNEKSRIYLTFSFSINNNLSKNTSNNKES